MCTYFYSSIMFPGVYTRGYNMWLRHTLLDWREFEVRPILAQLSITCCLLELPVCFCCVKLWRCQGEPMNNSIVSNVSYLTQYNTLDLLYTQYNTLNFS